MSIPPRQQAPAPAGVNARLNVSAGGSQAIQDREGYRDHYYDDIARNCSIGVGTLVHMGPCSFQERGRPVPAAIIQNNLTSAINQYAAVVRRGVPSRTLTQNQFDALTSFVYNVPALAPQLLRHVEAGEDSAALDIIRSAVNYHDHDAHGHVRGPARWSPGLAIRRAGEVAQYNRQ